MRTCVILRRHSAYLQRLADLDGEAADARALAFAPVATAALEVSAAADMQMQLQMLQERFAKAELARVKDAYAAAAEHSEQLHRLHHKLAAAEMQVLALHTLLPPVNESRPPHTCAFASLQVQLLQKHDAILEKSVQALAADVTGKGSQRALLPPRAQAHFSTDQLPTPTPPPHPPQSRRLPL